MSSGAPKPDSRPGRRDRYRLEVASTRVQHETPVPLAGALVDRPPGSSGLALWTLSKRKVGVYRSVYPKDGMSIDATNRMESKTSGSAHPHRYSEIYGPGALRHTDYLVPYTSSYAHCERS